MATNYEKMASQIIRELEMQRQWAIDIQKSSRKVEELRRSIKDSYPEFIGRCLKDSPSKFVEIKRFPTTEEISSFYQYGSPKITDDLLMYDYGWFDIKELAAIIKLLYSLKKQKEYSIVTLANLEGKRFGPEASDIRIVLYLNFLIGLEQKHLEEYNGKYFNKPSLEGNILDKYDADRHPGLVRLKQGRNHDNIYNKSGTCVCRFEDGIRIYPTLWHLDSLINWDDNTVFSSQYNIFDKHIMEIVRKLDKEPRSKVCSLLSFSLDFQDAFIARNLFSIVIYKKKTNKLALDNDDYKYIFYELFKSDIDVLEVVDREIPKVLIKSK